MQSSPRNNRNVTSRNVCLALGSVHFKWIRSHFCRSQISLNHANGRASSLFVRASLHRST